MLGWIIAGMLLGAAIVITVSYLSESVAKQKAQEKCPDAVSLMIKQVYKSGNINKVKMDALDSYGSKTEIEFEADSISSDIYTGKRIYV